MSAVLQQSDYAIRCLLFLVEHRDRLVTKSEISEAVGAPDLFVAKILQRLVKANILISVRGIHGGFSLAREPSAISLLDVLGASQASLAFRPCVLNAKTCSFQVTCPVRPVWGRIYESTVRELRQTTFDKLTRESKGKMRAPTRRRASRR
jgi:Rrf2 family protein